jgi:hypothetical protein
MNSLLGHGVTNRISPLLCALEHSRTEQRTSDTGCEMRFFVLRSGDEKCGYGFAGYRIDGIAKERRVCMVQTRVSPVPFLTCSVTASGLVRRPAASSLFCFVFGALRVTVSICDGPSVNAELRPWESRPLARQRPSVTRADREFKSGDSKCF